MSKRDPEAPALMTYAAVNSGQPCSISDLWGVLEGDEAAWYQMPGGICRFKCRYFPNLRKLAFPLPYELWLVLRSSPKMRFVCRVDRDGGVLERVTVLDDLLEMAEEKAALCCGPCDECFDLYGDTKWFE
jgi:hypothetical protein